MKLNKETMQLFNDTRMLLQTKYSPYYENKIMGIENRGVVFPRIPIPKVFGKTRYNQHFSWGKKVLSVYTQALTVDAFKNDNLGFTRLYYDSSANHAVESCIEKSLFAGVSFLWIVKDDSTYKSKFLVRGAHTSTVVKDSNDEIVFAITMVDTSSLVNPEYFIYTKDKFYKVDENGSILDAGSSEGVDILVFSVDAEYGNSSIGKSIFSNEFFTAQKNASIAQNLLQQGAILTLTNKNLMIADNMEPTVHDNETESEKPALEDNSEIPGITTIFNPNNNGSLSLHALEEVSTENVKELIRENAKIAASMVFLSPETFGYPEEIKVETGFKERIGELRKQYSSVIESVGRIVMKNYLNISQEDESWGDLDVRFYEPTNISSIGQIGDALYKLNQLGIDISTVTDSLIGRELKPEKMMVPLPTRVEDTTITAESVEDSIKREEEFLTKLTTLTDNANTVVGGENNA